MPTVSPTRCLRSGTAKGILPFDVPAGSTLTSIELHESFNSPGTKIAIP